MKTESRDESIEYFQGERLIWFNGTTICVDPKTWANFYMLPTDDAQIRSHIVGRLGKVQIVPREQEAP